MRSLNDRWSCLPAAVRWIVGGALTLLIYAAAYVAVASIFSLDSDADDLLIRCLLLLLSIPFAIAGFLVQRRRLGGKGQFTLYRQAYRTGQIPEGADVGRWRPLVRKQARFFREGRQAQRILWIVLGVLVLGGGGVAIAASPGRRLGLTVFVVVFAVVLGAAWFGVDRMWRWRRRQFDRLERALDSAA